MITRCCLAMALATACGTAHAADRFWNGAHNSDWYNPLNWSGFPSGSDRAVFADGATRYTVNLMGVDGFANAVKFDSPNPYVISNGAIHFGDLSTVAAGAMVTHTFNSEVWVDAGSTWSINELAPVEVAGLFRPTGTPSEPFPSETEPMTKGGAGTLIISGDNGNVYTHVIVISGEVILRNGDALPDVGQLEIKPGATLTMEDDETIGTLWNQGHVALGSNTLRLAGTLFAETRGISGTVTGDANSRLVMGRDGILAH